MLLVRSAAQERNRGLSPLIPLRCDRLLVRVMALVPFSEEQLHRIFLAIILGAVVVLADGAVHRLP